MIVEQKKNGFGLRYGVAFGGEPDLHEPWFDDHKDLIEDVFTTGAVVLSGEPGAGKSHITQDVFYGAYSAGKAVCMVSCHVNAGSVIGRTVTQETFDTAADIGEDCLVVADNLDYLVYTGAVKRRRTDAKVVKYAEFMTDNLLRLRESGCAIFATVHTDLWRDNHSSAPGSVRAQYDTLVGLLGGESIFAGDVSQANATRLLCRRGTEPMVAAAIAADLAKIGALQFRQANHISVETYQKFGIQRATASVEAVKQHKIAGGM
jgi:hypothetical protein